MILLDVFLKHGCGVRVGFEAGDLRLGIEPLEEESGEADVCAAIKYDGRVGCCLEEIVSLEEDLTESEAKGRGAAVGNAEVEEVCVFLPTEESGEEICSFGGRVA